MSLFIPSTYEKIFGYILNNQLAKLIPDGVLFLYDKNKMPININ